MKKNEIKNLDDKDLQLRYFLGGLKNINDESENICVYWLCDIDCSCNIVADDERLDAVKNFIKKHNITNERFLKLSYNYLIGSIMKYRGTYAQLFLELEEVLKPYQFTKTNKGAIANNNFKEKELEYICSNPSNSLVGNFILKYKLTAEDFIILAKTILNHNLYGLHVSNSNDTFIIELKNILNYYKLTVSKEYIEEYRKIYQSKQELAELITETKIAQKRYLELIKELLIKDFDLAIELFGQELDELGFNNVQTIKRLIIENKNNKKN